MKWLTAPALAIAALMAPVAAQATPAATRLVTDCPLRDAPFTLDSPLYDVLLSPAAKAAVERVRPGFVAGIPPFFASSEVPSFATILSFKTMVRFNPATTQAELDQLAAALRTVPVTAADRVARCARYDNDRPNLTVTPGRPGQPRVLIFEKMTGFRDGPSVEAARAAFVGDSIYDVMAAKNAGVPSVAVSFGFLDRPAAEFGADHVIDHYDELVPLLATL